LTSATWTGVNGGGRPERLASPRLVRSGWAHHRPRHLRTVSTLTCTWAPITGFGCPAAASSTILARCTSRWVLVPARVAPGWDPLSNSNRLSSGVEACAVAAGRRAAIGGGSAGSGRRRGGRSRRRTLTYASSSPAGAGSASGNDCRARPVGGVRRLLLRVEVAPHSNVDVGALPPFLGHGVCLVRRPPRRRTTTC